MTEADKSEHVNDWKTGSGHTIACVHPIFEVFLNCVHNVRVPTMANDTAWLGADPDLELLGPYDPVDAGTDVVRGRNSCFLPPPFVPLFLNAPLKPRDAWEQVASQVLARDAAFVTACQPLLDWLRMAITREAVNFPSSIIRVQLEASVATPALLNHRHQLLI